MRFQDLARAPARSRPTRMRRWPFGILLAACLALAPTTILLGCGTTISTEPWTTPAEAARADGDLTTAIALYQAALDQFPDDPAVRARLGVLLAEDARAHAEAGRLAMAEDRFERAVALGGDTVATPDLLLHMAAARRDAMQGWQAEAELLEQAWQRTEPADAELTRRLAIGWDEAGDAERALPYYDVLVANDGPEASLVMRRAQLLAGLERPLEAETAWQRYLALEPSSLPGHIGLASVYEQQGRMPEAEAVLVALTDAQDDPTPVLKVLRAFYRRTQNPEGLARVEAQLAELRPPPPDRNLRPLKER